MRLGAGAAEGEFSGWAGGGKKSGSRERESGGNDAGVKIIVLIQ